MKSLAIDSIYGDSADLKISNIKPDNADYFLKFESRSRDNKVWQSFLDGLKTMYHYAERSRVDAKFIARANLRLLHRSLLANSSYSEKLIEIENEVPEKNVTGIYNLMTMQDLKADLITLQPSCSSHFVANNRFYNIYMIIKGKVTIKHHTGDDNNLPLGTDHKVWWKNIWLKTDDKSYRQGDVFFLGEKFKGNKISAEKHRCVLLRLTLSV